MQFSGIECWPSQLSEKKINNVNNEGYNSSSLNVYDSMSMNGQ